jgi:hypothetical protein
MSSGINKYRKFTALSIIQFYILILGANKHHLKLLLLDKASGTFGPDLHYAYQPRATVTYPQPIPHTNYDV